MPRSQKVDPQDVVWLAPETLAREALAEELAQTDDVDEILELLRDAPTTGQYRELEGSEVVDGPGGTTVIAPIYGDLVVWVDEAPSDSEDGSGHFERYSGPEEEYEPRRVA